MELLSHILLFHQNKLLIFLYFIIINYINASDYHKIIQLILLYVQLLPPMFRYQEKVISQVRKMLHISIHFHILCRELWHQVKVYEITILNSRHAYEELILLHYNLCIKVYLHMDFISRNIFCLQESLPLLFFYFLLLLYLKGNQPIISFLIIFYNFDLFLIKFYI